MRGLALTLSQMLTTCNEARSAEPGGGDLLAATRSLSGPVEVSMRSAR